MFLRRDTFWPLSEFELTVYDKFCSRTRWGCMNKLLCNHQVSESLK
jgi:hypothetical protein